MRYMIAFGIFGAARKVAIGRAGSFSHCQRKKNSTETFMGAANVISHFGKAKGRESLYSELFKEEP